MHVWRTWYLMEFKHRIEPEAFNRHAPVRGSSAVFVLAAVDFLAP